MAEREDTRGYVPEAERGIKTVAARVTLRDFAALRRCLYEDELSYQAFVEACVAAYIRGDKRLAKVLADRKRTHELAVEDGGLTPQARNAIFDQIERSEEDPR